MDAKENGRGEPKIVEPVPMDETDDGPVVRIMSGCAIGEHSETCGHVAVQHDDHEGYLNDDGQLDCKVDGQIVQHDLELVNGADIVHKDDHAHGVECGHPAIAHGDHTDYLVDGVIHRHVKGAKCTEHGRVAVCDDPPLVEIQPVQAPTKRRTRREMKRLYQLSDEYSREQAASGSNTRWYRDKDALKFVAMFILTGVYFVVELVYGLGIGSLGLIADAMHMLSDFIALVVGYYAMRASKRETSYGKTFGLKRMEIVASLMNATFMLSICLNMFMEAFNKFMEGYKEGNNLEENVDTLLIVTYVGLGLNVVGLFLFGGDHGHGHSHGADSAEHSHNHSHSDSNGDNYTPPKRGCFDRMMPSNLNIRGVLLHVMGDALGSIAVAISGLIIKYGKGTWKMYSDPVSAVLISFIIIAGTIPLVKDSARVLLNTTPEGIDVRRMISSLLKVAGVAEIHDFHVWTLVNSKIVASMHVVMSSTGDFMRVSDELKLILHSYGIHSSTIQPEVSNLPFSQLFQQSHPCMEPICSKMVCTEHMCCPEKRQMISKTASEHRKAT